MWRGDKIKLKSVTGKILQMTNGQTSSLRETSKHMQLGSEYVRMIIPGLKWLLLPLCVLVPGKRRPTRGSPRERGSRQVICLRQSKRESILSPKYFKA